MLRLLIDENFNHRILRGLKSRLPKLDYVVVNQIGMAGHADLELLDWAAQENRIIVTQDKETMIGYVTLRLREGKPIPGVIFVPQQLAIGRAIEHLEISVECLAPAELVNQIKYLPL